jgi:hypothetical protein
MPSTRIARSARGTFIASFAVSAMHAAGIELQADAIAPLQGRDINGRPVDASSVSAVMEFDPNLGLTWLRDWNVAFPADWTTSNYWAQALLTVGPFTGWRLPTSGEYGALWNEVGSSYSGLTSIFSNVVHPTYWSSTYQSSGIAHTFHPFSGTGDYQYVVEQEYGVAVRLGDVAAVPAPRTYALMLAGLGVLGVAVRRRTRNA